MYDTDTAVLNERYALASERIREIAGGQGTNEAPPPFRDYFDRVGSFILLMDDIRAGLVNGDVRPEEDREAVERAMYEDVLPENYRDSYANPAVAARKLGRELGPMLASLYARIRGMTDWVTEGAKEEIVIHLELFLEVYGCFGENRIPAQRTLRQVLYWFALDYCEVLTAGKIRRNIASRKGPVHCLADPQYAADHEEDAALYLDRRYMQRHLAAVRSTCKELGLPENAEIYAGTIIFRAIGEKTAGCKKSPQALTFSEKQRMLLEEMIKSR